MNQNDRFESFQVDEREELIRLAEIADSFQPDERFLKKTEMQLRDAFAAKKEKTMLRSNLFWQGLLGTAALAALTLGTIWMVRSVAPEPLNPAAPGEAPTVALSASTPTPEVTFAPTVITRVCDKVSYHVQANDTLASIAESHSISVEELKSDNGLNLDKVFTGQNLIIPICQHDWRGITVYRTADFPDAPSKVDLYIYSPSEPPVTVESARALAQRLGVDGQISSEGEHAYSYLYLASEGEKRLFINSDQDFLYVFGDTKSLTAMPLDKAQQIIEPYLKAHGFDFKHKIQAGSVPGWFIVVPLTVDGLPTYFGPSQIQGLSMAISQDDQILQMQANLLSGGGDSLGKSAIFSAKEAWQKFIDPNASPEIFVIPAEPPSPSAKATLTIETIDLVYYLADPHNSASTGAYLQPVWRFYGHYSDGNKFECLVRALIPE